MSDGTAFVRYVYAQGAPAVPISNLELWVRKSNARAWQFVVRPDDIHGLAVDDFAPAGGTRFNSSEMQDTLDDSLKKGSMSWDVLSGPLKGCVVILRMDKTFAIKSHAEAYP